MQDWWWDSASDLGAAVASAIILYVLLIVASRITGLRTYSKMSGFDFPLTVAVGTLVASTILSPDPPLVRAAVILAVLLLLQGGIAGLRERFPWARRAVDNKAIVLVRDGQVLQENMRRARVSLPELRAKIRGANGLRLDRVRAVVLETTGDVSVLQSSQGERLDDWIMEDVRGWEESPGSTA